MGKSPNQMRYCCGYPPVNIQKAIEHGPFSSLIYQLKMVIFHSYVTLPESKSWFLILWIPNESCWNMRHMRCCLHNFCWQISTVRCSNLNFFLVIYSVWADSIIKLQLPVYLNYKFSVHCDKGAIFMRIGSILTDISAFHGFDKSNYHQTNHGLSMFIIIFLMKSAVRAMKMYPYPISFD